MCACVQQQLLPQLQSFSQPQLLQLLLLPQQQNKRISKIMIHRPLLPPKPLFPQHM